MRKVTSDFKNQIERDNRNYYEWVDITLKDGTVLNLTNKNIWNSGIKIEDAVSDTSEFQIGTAIINKATVTLNNLYDDFTDYDFDEAKIVIYIGYNIATTTVEESWRDINGEQILDVNGNEILLLHNGTFLEKVKMFTGTVVDSPYQNSSLITLTCEDNMLLFDRDYSESKLIYPATRAQILRDACEVCGVSLETLTFENSDYIVNTRPSDEKLTFRQVIAWTAQLGGQFLRCNSDGKLFCGWYDLKNYEADTVNEEYFDVIASNSSVTVNSEDVIITGIQVTAYQENQSEEEAADTSLYGKAGYVIAIADNKLIEKGTASTVAAMIGERVTGMRFRPFSASTLNNPTYEAGDICIIKDRKGVSYKSFLTSSTFQVGKYHTVQCGAKSAAKNSSKQYSVFSQAQVENRKNFQREKKEREKAVEEFNKVLDSASGMYPTEVKQEDGSTILYVHDKKTLKDSKNVFKITSDAVGFSTDGGKTYPFGFTLDGDFLTRILYAIGINADYINTGAITVKDSDGNIIFQADIANKRVIISGDYVQIGGKTATDAIKAANSTASNALTAAQNARNMTLQLSNDYYSVNVDSNGKYSEFPKDVTTKAQVMYGANDITSECAFSITKSDNISGTWDSVKHQYTVTALTADTGWVNIQATYLSKLTVTKQFTVTKLYAGAKGVDGNDGKTSYVHTAYANITYICEENSFFTLTSTTVCRYGKKDKWVYKTLEAGTYTANSTLFGRDPVNGVFKEVNKITDFSITDSNGRAYMGQYTDFEQDGSDDISKYVWVKVQGEKGNPGKNGEKGTPGRTYFIELSSRVLKRSKDNTIAPNFFTIKGFYRDGNSTTRVAYNGRFTIEETNDGNTWKRVYTSPADESSVTHSLYTAIATGSGTNSVVGDGKGNAIGFPRDTIAVRCTMYASGGTTTTLDVQDCAILVDVDALTQEEIFNALTNNGEVKGIYKEGNQLYISFTYAKGGELTLGGLNDGNGTLNIYNDSNFRIGRWSKDGIVISGGSFKTGNNEISNKNVELESPKIFNRLYMKLYKEDTYIPVLIPMPKGTGANDIINVDFGSATAGERINRMRLQANRFELTTYSGDDPAIEISGKARMGDVSVSGLRMGSANCTGKITTYQLETSGYKNRYVETENYGERLLFSYETSSPMFGDVGSAVIDEDGMCYIDIEQMFSETANVDIDYYVFLQKEGSGDIWVEKKEENYFVVRGTPKLKFSWELKAKQREFETERMEIREIPMVEDIDYLKETARIAEDVDYESEGYQVYFDYIKNNEEEVQL